jgi:hypothetical protein
MGVVAHFKIEDINKYKVFIETGTSHGSGANFLAQQCERGYTIDLFDHWNPKAPNVKFLQGNSTEHLEKLCQEVEEDVVFWLDAHYPHLFGTINETMEVLPLVKELEIITKYRSNKKDLILIDDLRIYEKLNYRSGQLPFDLTYGETGFLDKVKNLFPNREVKVDLDDEGYVSIWPNE